MKDPVLLPKVEVPNNSLFVTTFGNKVHVDMKSTKDLMNWIVFGDIKQKGFSFNSKKDTF